MRNSLARRLAAAVLSLGCAVAHADDWDGIKQKGILEVAVYKSFPPFSSADSGIDVEIARAVAEKLGLKAEFYWFDADESMDDDLRNVVWKGHYLARRVAHVMMHVPVDPVLMEGNGKVRIFAPYHHEQVAMARNTTHIPVMAGLAGLHAFIKEKIGVEVGTLADDFLSGSLGGRIRENVVRFRSIMEATEALKDDRISAVMGTRSELEAGLGKLPDNILIAPFHVTGIPVSGWNLGLATKAENTVLAATLERTVAGLVQDGTISRIFAKYGATHVPPRAAGGEH